MPGKRQRITNAICFCRRRKKSQGSVPNWSAKPRTSNRILQRNATDLSREKKISSVWKPLARKSRRRLRRSSRMLLNSKPELRISNPVRKLNSKVFQDLRSPKQGASYLKKQSVNIRMIWL